MRFVADPVDRTQHRRAFDQRQLQPTLSWKVRQGGADENRKQSLARQNEHCDASHYEDGTQQILRAHQQHANDRVQSSPTARGPGWTHEVVRAHVGDEEGNCDQASDECDRRQARHPTREHRYGVNSGPRPVVECQRALQEHLSSHGDAGRCQPAWVTCRIVTKYQGVEVAVSLDSMRTSTCRCKSQNPAARPLDARGRRSKLPTSSDKLRGHRSRADLPQRAALLEKGCLRSQRCRRAGGHESAGC